MMMHDERVVVKSAVMQRVGFLMVAELLDDKKADYLMLMFSYMKRFRVFENILEPALGALLIMCDAKGGPEFLESCCPDMLRFLSTECSEPARLRYMACVILNRCDTEVKTAEFLGTLSKALEPT